MKYYMILSPGIWDMGGAQMYTRNKLKYLKENSYDVNLFHGGVKGGKILIEDLLEYKKNRYFHLNYPAYLFNERTQEKVLALICKQVKATSSEFIIESHSIANSTWGELLAKRLKAKHIIYLLSEKSSIRNKSAYKFFKFKLERKELVGIQEKSIPLLFRGWEHIGVDKSYMLLANCMNVVENISFSKLSKVPDSDYIIGSIGRVNKLFLLNILDDIIAFIKEHKNKSFTLVLIGGEPSNSNATKQIKEKFSNIKNVSLYVTGYIYPIPKELILFCDVYISSAGSCYVSNSLGVPTISIDSNDHKPIGILGKTTSNTIFRNNEPQLELPNLLEEIIIKRVYVKEPIDETDDWNIDFSDHLQFITASNNSKSYFEVNSFDLSVIDHIEKWALFFLGDNFYRQMSMRLWPLWHKFKK
jgi:hypothetical protein